MQNIAGWFLLGAVFLALLGGVFNQKQQTGVIKIGGMFALSDSAADWGQDEMRAAQIAINEANAKGGVNGKHIQFVVEDAPATEGLSNSVSAFQKLVTVDDVVAVIGPTWDNAAQAIAPLSTQLKTVVVAPDMSSGVEGSHDYPYLFSTSFPVDSETLRMAKFAQEKGYRRLSIIRNTDPFSTVYAKDFSHHLQSLGISLVKDIAIADLSSKDFRTYLLILKQESTDAVFLVLNDEAAKCPFLEQAKQLDLGKPLLSNYSTQSPSSVSQCGDVLSQILYTYPKQGIAYEDLLKKYKSIYNATPSSPVTANAYDAAKLIIMELEAGHVTSDSIRRGLLELKNYSGPTGEDLSFSSTGSLIMPSINFVIKSFQDGQFVTIE